MKIMKYINITVDYELIAKVSGKVFRGTDYEGVLRVETKLPVSLFTNNRYIPNIVRRFIDDNSERWKREGERIVEAELGEDVYEVGSKVREAFFVSGERSQHRRSAKYTTVGETFVVFIESRGREFSYNTTRQNKRRFF